MPINRVAHPELYDSLHESDRKAPTPISQRRPPPLPVPARAEAETVAVAVSPPLAAAVREALDRAGLVVGGRERLRTAAVVVVDADLEDVGEAVTAIRKEAASGAGVVVLLSGDRGSNAVGEAIRAASKAGAFACLKLPLVSEELQSMVTAAVDVGAAKAQVATLSQKLDLDAHLASIGRISAGLTHEIANPLGIAATNLDAIAADTENLFEMLSRLVEAPFAQLPTHLRDAQSELAHARGPDGMLTAIRDSRMAIRRISALLGTMRDLVGGVAAKSPDEVDLLAVANEVAQRWLIHERGGVQLSVVGSSVSAPADVVLLVQILQNITANAIHAVQAQSDALVRIHVYETESHAIVSVRDNGPGIPPDLQDRVFEPFFTTRRGTGGTGLGLALCREYATRLGADLSLWSVVGRGTCFRLTLPLR